MNSRKKRKTNSKKPLYVWIIRCREFDYDATLDYAAPFYNLSDAQRAVFEHFGLVHLFDHYGISIGDLHDHLWDKNIGEFSITKMEVF